MTHHQRCYARLKTKTPLVEAPQTCSRPGKHKGLCAQHARQRGVSTAPEPPLIGPR
jgi:hypothetical protein